MNREKTIKDFKSFLDENREKLLDIAIDINELPYDDEWINDNEWDEIYKQEKLRNGKV